MAFSLLCFCAYIDVLLFVAKTCVKLVKTGYDIAITRDRQVRPIICRTSLDVEVTLRKCTLTLTVNASRRTATTL